jgi:hypothetical protein
MGEGKAPEVPGRRLQIYWSINFFAKANSRQKILKDEFCASKINIDSREIVCQAPK